MANTYTVVLTTVKPLVAMTKGSPDVVADISKALSRIYSGNAQEGNSVVVVASATDGSAATYSTGSFTVGSNTVAANAVFTIGGTAVTISAGTDANANAILLRDAINAQAVVSTKLSAQILPATPTVVTLTPHVPGAVGNFTTVITTNTTGVASTVTGAALSGGADTAKVSVFRK